MVVQTPRGNGLLWLTVWDSAVEAAEFVDALGRVVAKRYGNAPAAEGAGGWRRATGRARTVALWGGEIAGRPAALYLDVPNGASTDIIDVGRVKLQE